MTRKQRRLSLIGAALGVIALAVALVSRRAQGVHRLLQFADRRGRKTHQTGDAYSRRRPGEAGQAGG
jgi:hypothetical protein